MSTFVRRATFMSAGLACLLLLSACGKKEAATPANQPSAASTTTATAKPARAATSAAATTRAGVTGSADAKHPPAAEATARIAVVKLTLGDAVDAEHQVTHASNTFPANTKIIYASVATSGRTMEATLNAKWSYLEGRGQLVSSISQAIATTGPAITTFKVQNPDLWPEGKYEVEISLDGKSITKQGFEITKS